MFSVHPRPTYVAYYVPQRPVYMQPAVNRTAVSCGPVGWHSTSAARAAGPCLNPQTTATWAPTQRPYRYYPLPYQQNHYCGLPNRPIIIAP